MSGLDPLRALFMPATQVVRASKPPKVRKECCAKCPFGTGLTGDEQRQADAIKARLAGRMAGGEPVLWGCHETVAGKAPQVCAGFAEWSHARPDLE